MWILLQPARAVLPGTTRGLLLVTGGDTASAAFPSDEL
jgi:hypothetical protein